jgi:hypothetical protein
MGAQTSLDECPSGSARNRRVPSATNPEIADVDEPGREHVHDGPAWLRAAFERNA